MTKLKPNIYNQFQLKRTIITNQIFIEKNSNANEIKRPWTKLKLSQTIRTEVYFRVVEEKKRKKLKLVQRSFTGHRNQTHTILGGKGHIRALGDRGHVSAPWDMPEACFSSPKKDVCTA